MAVTKDGIKKAYESKMARKEKVRRIESIEERTVHFVFNPRVPCKVTPFTRKYRKLLDGNLAEFEENEREKFARYTEAMETETLAEEEQYPIVFEDSPFFSLELTGLSRIAFAVADDPFCKVPRAKYYPELVLVNKKSKVKAVINPAIMGQPRTDKYGQVFEYCEDFREPSLKVNDDRKVRINLAELMKDGKPGKMILLTVKCNNLKGMPKN